MRNRSFLTLFIVLIVPSLLRGQQALEDSLNRVIAENKDEGEVAKAYNSLAYEYSRKDLVKSRAYLNAAINICKRTGNFKRLSSFYSQLVCLLHDAGKPDSAEYYIDQVNSCYEQADGTGKNETGSN